jgi:hypothetical protein
MHAAVRVSEGDTVKLGLVRIGVVATLSIVVSACSDSSGSTGGTLDTASRTGSTSAAPPSPSDATLVTTATTSSTPASSTDEATTPTSAPIVCPNVEGGSCLGPVAAGTYTTTVFRPTLTYTVPDGWSNFEDTPGNFLLVPPSYDLPGVNGGTSDFIGVYSTIAAPNGCEPGSAPGVGSSPEALSDWYKQHPGLDVTSTPTTIGGRSGFVVDMRMRKDWVTACPYSNGTPIVPTIVGTGISGLDHNIGAGQAVRLYLLSNTGGTMVVEVVDIADAGHLDAYAPIVEAMAFAD